MGDTCASAGQWQQKGGAAQAGRGNRRVGQRQECAGGQAGRLAPAWLAGGSAGQLACHACRWAGRHACAGQPGTQTSRQGAASWRQATVPRVQGGRGSSTPGRQTGAPRGRHPEASWRQAGAPGCGCHRGPAGGGQTWGGAGEKGVCVGGGREVQIRSSFRGQGEQALPAQPYCSHTHTHRKGWPARLASPARLAYTPPCRQRPRWWYMPTCLPRL